MTSKRKCFFCDENAEGKFMLCTKHETESRIYAHLPPSETIKIMNGERDIYGNAKTKKIQ